MKLFLGPGNHLILPMRVKSLTANYSLQYIPWGWWYEDAPFRLVRKAAEFEIYILSGAYLED